MLEALERSQQKMSEEAITKMACFVESQMTDESVFVDKGGKQDLYYTAFGLMLAYILKIKIDAKKTTKWLDQFENRPIDLIHYAAYIRCKMLVSLIEKGKVRTVINQIFTQKKSLPQFTSYPQDNIQTPYSQFILFSLMEDMGMKIKNKVKLKDRLVPYRVINGGYSNTSNGNSATSNATAAALSLLGQMGNYKPNSDIEYLQHTQENNGGFKACDIVPIPDILSTATSLFVLNCYKIKPLYQSTDFIESHWLNSGGFCPTLIDEYSDVEYTFYGLLALGSCK